jgi:BASS family bile acid:Na+ symporter
MLNSPKASKTTLRMFIFRKIIAALAFLGRHGTIAVALSIFIGLLVPMFAATFKPLLGPAIFLLLLLAFLRVEPAALGVLVRRPAMVIATAVWVMLALPVALATIFAATGLKSSMPDLYFILILQVCAPALTSAPALAALMGLDVALTLAALVCSMALAPAVAAVFGHYFLGRTAIAPLDFGLKLFLFIAGAAALAVIVRRFVGQTRIDKQHDLIDGLSVIAMFIFAMASMDGVSAYAQAEPRLVLGLMALAFALAIGAIVLTTLVFLPTGRKRAFAIGILTGNRNIGVMMAATGFSVPPVVWLYFGVAQFPIYLLPVFLKWLAGRLPENR